MRHIKTIDDFCKDEKDAKAIIFSEISQEYFDKIPLNDIKKQTKDFSLYNTHKVFGNPLSGKIGNDKCLLESLVKSFPVLSFKKHIIKKYEPLIRYKVLPEHLKQLLGGCTTWVLNISSAAINAFNTIVNFYDLEDWQIITPRNDDGTYTHIIVIIPDLNENIVLMDESMKCFGYYRSCNVDVRAMFPKIKNMNKWVVLQYEQKVQDFINDKIRKEANLYHVSPTYIEHKILKNGLVPKSKNEQFNYPDRVYLLKEDIISITDGLKIIANMLYNGKLMHVSNSYVNDKDYTFYKINISKIPKNVNFSIDYNFVPLSVFSADNIPPNAIEIIEHYTVS